jgi:hypothetical protein
METLRQGFHLVRRWKGVVCHYGVLAALPGRPTTVLELLPEGYGEPDYADFARGRRVTILDEWRPPSEEKAIRERFSALRGTHPRWTLFGHNCEHTARWALTGRRESRQVSACATAAAVAAVLVLGFVRLVVRR